MPEPENITPTTAMQAIVDTIAATISIMASDERFHHVLVSAGSLLTDARELLVQCKAVDGSASAAELAAANGPQQAGGVFQAYQPGGGVHARAVVGLGLPDQNDLIREALSTLQDQNDLRRNAPLNATEVTSQSYMLDKLANSIDGLAPERRIEAKKRIADARAQLLERGLALVPTTQKEDTCTG